MLTSAHVRHQPTAPCPSILGRELRFGSQCQRMFDRGEGTALGNARGFWGLGFGFQLSVPRGAIVHVWILTINQVGHVLWLIYKMSKLFE